MYWDLRIQHGENPTPDTFKRSEVDPEGSGSFSHVEYLALLDQDDAFLNANADPLDIIVDELAEDMDI